MSSFTPEIMAKRAAKKRWKNVSKAERSRMMKAVRAGKKNPATRVQHPAAGNP